MKSTPPWDDILAGLDEEIADIIGRSVKRRRAHYEKTLERLTAAMQADAERYIGLLAGELLTVDEFDHLIRGRWAQLRIELLAEVAITRSKFEQVTNQVLGAVIRRVLDLIGRVGKPATETTGTEPAVKPKPKRKPGKRI